MTEYSKLPSINRGVINRFWVKVDSVSDRQQCWVWMASKFERGYGQFSYQDRNFKAHRMAYKLHTGHDPVGLIMHTCDNPPCCNPSHLVDANHSLNTIDSVAKGRHKGVPPRNDTRGALHSSSKLTTEMVLEIRAFHSQGHDVVALAKCYGVTDGTIRSVIHGRTYKNV